MKKKQEKRAASERKVAEIEQKIKETTEEEIKRLEEKEAAMKVESQEENKSNVSASEISTSNPTTSETTVATTENQVQISQDPNKKTEVVSVVEPVKKQENSEMILTNVTTEPSKEPEPEKRKKKKKLSQ